MIKIKFNLTFGFKLIFIKIVLKFKITNISIYLYTWDKLDKEVYKRELKL